MTGPGRVGPWIQACLAARGIDRVFGIPGVHTTPLYDGLGQGPLTHVTPRHEQAAGFMADGFARVAGRPAACFVITGPGLTNILTAMGQAHGDSVPMLVISSTSRRRHLGRGTGQLHELRDQSGMAAGVAAFSRTLHALADLPEALDRAMAVFAARPRPVHVEIPLDLWEETPPDTVPPPAPVPRPSVPEGTAIAEAARRLAAAGRPVILAGGGARRAAGPLAAVARRLDAPVVTTVNARGLLAPGDPLSVPASPSLGAVRDLIAESDAMLAVGTEMGPTDCDMYAVGMPDWPAPLVRVDIDPDQLATGVAPDHALRGDAAATLAALGAALGEGGAPRGGAGRAEAAREGARAGLSTGLGRAADLLAAMREAVPEATVVGDSTHPVYAGNLLHAAPRPGAWFNSATGFGTLGYGLPAAIGAALADPDRPVICLVGDGGLHYSLGELATLARTGARVTVLVWNNAAYGEIRSAMREEGIDPVGVELGAPDFAALGAAYGLPVGQAAGAADLPGLLASAAASGGPSLVVVEEAAALA